MSGPAVHYLVGKDVRTYLTNVSNEEVQRVVNEMINHPTYLNAGTLGPDFLFFNTKDMPGPVGDVFDLYRDVARFVNDFKKEISGLLEIIESAKEKAQDAIDSSVVLSQVQGLIGQANGLIGALMSLVQEKVKYHITDSIDVFNLLAHPIQVGEPPDRWWWFDTLHYRRTGKFAQTLLELSEPGTKKHAYAMGYLSHIGSDVVGHPFINMIVGGPYRYQPQRHKVIESFQDVFALNEYEDREFVQSRMHDEFNFFSSEYDAGRLPHDIKALFLKALEATYGNDFGRPMSIEDIDNAYWLWYQWFRNTTETGTLPEPVPYSLTGELQEAWETFTNNTEGIGDMIEDAWNAGGGGFLGFLAALAAAIIAPFLLAAAIFDYLAGTLLTVGVAPFRYLLSVAYESLYNSYWRYREGVALNGLGYPLVRHCQNPWVKHMIDPRFADNLGNLRQIGEAYPRMKMSSTLPGLEGVMHLFYPFSAPVEHAQTVPCCSHYYRQRFDWYIKGNVPYDPEILERILTLDESNITELRNIITKYPLGNAPRFTAELYLRFLQTGKVPDFNLDGDRGMGYKCWRVIPTPQDPQPPVTSPVQEDII